MGTQGDPFQDMMVAIALVQVIDGDDGYDSNDPARSWPKLWYGVKGYFRWLESKSYKMHVRVLLSRYRSYTRCEDCGGGRARGAVRHLRGAAGGGRGLL